MKLPKLTRREWLTTISIGVSIVAYALIFSAAPKQQSGAQALSYLPNTTIAMDASLCTSLYSGSAIPFVFTGTTAACGAWPKVAGLGGRLATDSTGLLVWTFPAGCLDGSNIPTFNALAEGPSPQAGVSVNVQVEGAPTATTVSFRVTKSSATVVSLLGLTILSIPASVGVTELDTTCSPT